MTEKTLTDNQIRAIAERHKEGEPIKGMAYEHGVSSQHISDRFKKMGLRPKKWENRAPDIMKSWSEWQGGPRTLRVFCNIHNITIASFNYMKKNHNAG